MADPTRLPDCGSTQLRHVRSQRDYVVMVVRVAYYLAIAACLAYVVSCGTVGQRW